MTEDEEMAATREIQTRFTEYMASDEFHARCSSLDALFDAGEQLTTAEIADVLGMPESFVEFALTMRRREIGIRPIGTLQ